MPRSGFENATPATERPQTYALDRAATGIGIGKNIMINKTKSMCQDAPIIKVSRWPYFFVDMGFQIRFSAPDVF
jgi:hypothetical protein